MGLSMTNTLKLFGFEFLLVAVLLSGLQYKTMSPRVFQMLESIALAIGATVPFNLPAIIPANAIEWLF